MIFLSTSSGEVKGFAFKVISKVQFTGKENQQKDLFIYFLKNPVVVSKHQMELLNHRLRLRSGVPFAHPPDGREYECAVVNITWKKRKVVRIFTRLKEKLMREERNIEKVNNDEFLKWISTIKQKC